MKIAIDCRMIRMGGIGTYLKGILKYILLRDDLFLLIGNKKDLEQFKNKNIEILECNIPIFSLKELFLFPIHKLRDVDVYYSPNYNIPLLLRKQIFLTIHDVIYLDMPELANSYLSNLIRKIYIKYAWLKASKIFTDSKFSKERIISYLGEKKEIIITYVGYSETLCDINKSKLELTRHIEEEYLLYIGNIKPHKGLKTLIESFKKLKDNKLKLVIVGEKDNFRISSGDIFEGNRENEKLLFTGKILDDELLNYLVNAKLLIQPSQYEGFGIPPLEALVMGVPVILSDIPVFREIYPETLVTFFENKNSDDLAKKINEYKVKDIDSIELFKIIEKYSYKNIGNVVYEQIKK